MLWYLLVGTRGGANRIRILENLQHGRMNAHELAEKLGLDYRTVRHHLSLLEEGNAVFRPIGKTYASPYEVTAYIMANWGLIEELRVERSHRAAWRTAGTSARTSRVEGPEAVP